ncbi:MAG TPA: mechanosensitive ion channel family protein [Candidatus Altiarchaeales archaeon]|nr:mechanosensitive ion channel family protein [Candidatus Altiarchaeales archaeon]
MAFNLRELLTQKFWGNSIEEYLLALLIFILTIIALRVLKLATINKLRKIAVKTRTGLDDLMITIIDGIGWPFYLSLSLYVSLQFIKIPKFIGMVVYYATFVIVAYYVIIALQNLIDYGTRRIIERQGGKKVDTSAVDLLSKVLKAILWVVVIIIILSNLGYEVSTLIAGLGIGGVAIALAVQNILGDVFASFSIYFDKPFRTGDFIIVGDDCGVVKRIGIKTTRIQTLHGEELVISNRELTESRVHNYKKMERRRVVFTLGVTYDTPTEKLRKIPDIIKEVVDKIELADIDRVHFKEFGDFSLNFEIVYYVNSSDYGTYMDIRQEINLAIKERFETEGIEFAYPTQTVFVNEAS